MAILNKISKNPKTFGYVFFMKIEIQNKLLYPIATGNAKNTKKTCGINSTSQGVHAIPIKPIADNTAIPELTTANQN